MNKKNYQKELENILDGVRPEDDGAPTLFLHSCCGPCSSYVLEYLAPYFRITVFYYNPNISMEEEYRHRVAEQKRLIGIYNEEGAGHPIQVVEGDYQPSVFLEAVKDYQSCPEGGERCSICFRLRLRRTAMEALARSFDYFGTTLTISPMKNAEKLNEIGFELERELAEKGTPENGKRLLWLPSDFKKKGGYQRSIELSKKYGLYRQDFCGCCYSKAEREKQKAAGN